MQALFAKGTSAQNRILLIAQNLVKQNMADVRKKVIVVVSFSVLNKNVTITIARKSLNRVLAVQSAAATIAEKWRTAGESVDNTCCAKFNMSIEVS